MSNNKINVTKSFLPPVDDYQKYLMKIFDNHQLTNQGPLLKELEEKLSEYLQAEHFQYVANGTLALQLAIKALDINEGEIITTPFSYVATTSSILWEKCRPVFVDIEPDNFTIDASQIEQAITPNTKAIMAVHVFGYACDTEKIEKIAKKHSLKIIYDGAHAFGSKYKDKSLLGYGDVTTCSFHATKIFHTVEGGACIAQSPEINAKIELLKRFGHNGDEHFQLGINAKNSELHAAMGLTNLPYINQIITKRKELSEIYDSLLTMVQTPKKQSNLEYNYAYYPVIFESELQLLKTFDALAKENIFPRRYFYPSLNTLPYVKNTSCPISEDISKRIACLPIYYDLDIDTIKKTAQIIKAGAN